MQVSRITLVCAINSAAALILTACGGGGGGGGGESMPTDLEAPKVSNLTAQAIVGNTVTLSATAKDNVGVTGYCFKTNTTPPLAADTCFQSTPQKSGITLTPGTTQYVFAKDSAGNISTPLAGPCSASGYAASATSASDKSTVCMLTDKGEIVLELDPTKAPLTVANFLQYLNAGFYSATTFHRVISTFMVQGGGFTYANGNYSQKSANSPIALENKTITGLSNVRGTIAMARSVMPNTATSQFFINVVDNVALDASGGGYAVFGKVISGMDVVDQIKQVPVQNNGLGEISSPSTPVFVQWGYQLK